MSAAPAVGVTYFGKLPSQRDFVKSTDNHQLLALLDRWADQGLELLARDVDWKQHYDTAPEMSFAFVGSRSRVAVAGHFAPAHDASGRRYPFLSAARIEVVQPMAFMARSPLALDGLWRGLATHTHGAMGTEDAGPALRALGSKRFEIGPAAHEEEAFEAFLDQHSIGSFQAILQSPDRPRVRLDRAIPALGVLLQPLLTRPRANLGRGLRLPLPVNPELRTVAATLWLDLAAGFLARGHFELGVFMQSGPQPRLTLGFDGASSQGLHALLDPRVDTARNIDLADPEWADDAVDADPALGRLASYLAEDGLTLRRARDTFAETFFGT